MNPINFTEANTLIKRPTDLGESQCQDVRAYVGRVAGGSVDGAIAIVVAWQPTEAEIEEIRQGKPIFLSCLGGLPPHFLSTNFKEATHPA